MYNSNQDKPVLIIRTGKLVILPYVTLKAEFLFFYFRTLLPEVMCEVKVRDLLGNIIKCWSLSTTSVTGRRSFGGDHATGLWSFGRNLRNAGRNRRIDKDGTYRSIWGSKLF